MGDVLFSNFESDMWWEDFFLFIIEETGKRLFYFLMISAKIFYEGLVVRYRKKERRKLI